MAKPVKDAPAIERIRKGDTRSRGGLPLPPPLKRVADPGGLNHKAGRK